ncbi:MAG TPA: hypothetical protein VFX30_12260 [bacterium]|nr:hypothetical protein [bacterium]
MTFMTPPPTTFGGAFLSLAPLGAYVERAGLLGDVQSEIGPLLSRFVKGVNTASSSAFRYFGPAILSSLESLDASTRLSGLRRFQLALQLEGRDSEVVAEFARELEEPTQVELREELEKESTRLGRALKRHDKGRLGEIAVRWPFFRSGHDLVELSRKGNLQALRRAIDRGLLEKTLDVDLYSRPLYPDMIIWFAISEFFAGEPTSSHIFNQVALRDTPLVTDGFFMSALKLHRGAHLLRFHTFLMSQEHVEYHSPPALERLQQWSAVWVEGLRTLSRKIDIDEGLAMARYKHPAVFNDAAVGGLMELADERFSAEIASRINPTERSEIVALSRKILKILADRRPDVVAGLNRNAGSWWARRSPREPQRPAEVAHAVKSPAPPPPPSPPLLTVSLIASSPELGPNDLGEHSIFLSVGRNGQKTIPLPLVAEQELLISVDASDPSVPMLRLKYQSEMFQVVDIMSGVHLEEGDNRRPLKKRDWLNFGAKLSIAGYIVHVVKPARPIEME